LILQAMHVCLPTHPLLKSLAVDSLGHVDGVGFVGALHGVIQQRHGLAVQILMELTLFLTNDTDSILNYSRTSVQ